MNDAKGEMPFIAIEPCARQAMMIRLFGEHSGE